MTLANVDFASPSEVRLIGNAAFGNTVQVHSLCNTLYIAHISIVP
jgi:hypothetical protein